jgi:hypothetical protein
MKSIFVPLITTVSLFLSCHSKRIEFTRGIGIYPGNPAEDFSPDLRTDNDTYRNLAHLRAAYHSSSYDYNLTAQLVTDGIITEKVPAYISLETNHGPVPKNEREWVLDHVTGSAFTVDGNDIWVQFECGGEDQVPEISSIAVNGLYSYDESESKGWNFRLSGSDNGTDWVILAENSGSGLPGYKRPNPFEEMLKNMKKDSTGKPINPFADFFGPTDPNEPKPSFSFNFRPPVPRRSLDETFKFSRPVAYRYYRIDLNAPSATSWDIGDLNFYNEDGQVEMAPSHRFNSAWMSAGAGEEWITVDLGAKSSFDHLILHWINKAASGTIQVSDDGETWIDVADLPDTESLVDDIALEDDVHGRYVRVLMTEAVSRNYLLSEVQVMGRGGVFAVPEESPAATGNRLFLAGGNWKIKRSSLVSVKGEDLSQTGFSDENWVVATVPGTALSSYRNAGALPDPNFGDNQLMISESFFNSDFWYRNEFEVPASFEGKRLFLNFDGISWKAYVFVNSKKLGSIEGSFIRGQFDVTDLVRPGQKNAIAVLIRKQDHIGTIKEQTAIHPDKNGGIMGGDNPSFHASVGWDWIPTIRGRNIGIWNDVYLTATGGVTLEEPFVTTDLPLPNVSVADINIQVTVKNHLSEPEDGMLKGSYGDIFFEQEVSLEAGQSKKVSLNPDTHPVLKMNDPLLWWPKGYGEPHLYEVALSFETSDGDVSDSYSFQSGVREMAFDEENNILSLYINGRRFIGRGGNWGFPESNLNYRGREYDIAVGYHADMNFTMIRNWVGQTGDDEFYEACDRHGVMVWQDFWLANPVDGPDPYDPEMFMDNAEDMIKRIRNHPSIAIYVGRNEGNPPEILDTALHALIPQIHPGIHYISSSSFGVVSGGGPYRALPVMDYFLLYGRNKLHSERGMPNVMTYESLKKTLPEPKRWPQNSQWGLHDYCLEGAQGTASFNEMIEKGFGPVDNATQFTELAQWINYNGYRGMFEGRSKYRKGLILWMSHPAWPSMVWQTYDYYLEPTAAYFGCKKASEPIHIQWNPVFDTVEVVNLHGMDQEGLTAKALLINMDGTVQWEKDTVIDSNEDTTEKLFKLKFTENLSSVHFIKLSLMKGERMISENFYWRGQQEGNYQALNELPDVKIGAKTMLTSAGDKWTMETRLTNTTDIPALMIRLKITGKESGERILPALYSDNYVSLMPGDSRTINMSVRKEDARGEKPEVIISGFNLHE